MIVRGYEWRFTSRYVLSRFPLKIHPWIFELNGMYSLRDSRERFVLVNEKDILDSSQ